MAAKKPSLAERLGLVEREDGPQPALTPEEYAAEAASLQPTLEVDTSTISGDAVIESVYAQGSFQPDASLFRLNDFIASFPKELPTATKQASIAGILVATHISIADLIADGDQRVALLNGAATALKNDNAQRESERRANIEELKLAIQEAERQIAEDKQVTEDSCDAIEKELTTVNELLTFANGVQNAGIGG